VKPAFAEAGSEQIMLKSSMYANSKTTAPKWSKNVKDRILWCCWFLEHNPSVYNAFKAIADARVLRNPNKRISSESIVNTLRHDTNIRAEGDQYAINSNAKPLLARLYQIERPKANLDNRNSWLDHLTANEWQAIMNAWQRGNGSST
jgi:hypothetical protein